MTARDPSPSEIHKLAAKELKRRKIQFRHLPVHFFGDAAWAMLLDLFVSQNEGKRLSSTSLCHGTFHPQTTALRWLDVLIDEGFVVRSQCLDDRRVKYVALTARGTQAVERVLRSYYL